MTARVRYPLLGQVTTPDGAHLVVRGLRAADPAAPVAVILPAMGTPARFYAPFARALNGAGLSVVTVDLRGHGENTPTVARGIQFGYRQIVEHDIGAVLDVVRAEFSPAPLLLIGHSLGGQLALLHAAQSRPALRGVVLVASGSGWFRCFRPVRAIRQLVLSQLFVLIAALIGYWPGARFGFGGRESTGLMRDCGRQARTGRYRVTGSVIDYERKLRMLTLPVLAVDVDDDEVTPPSSVDHLCAKIPLARLTRWRYTREAAGDRSVDHFRWVRYHGGLVDRIALWLDSLVESPCVPEKD